MSTQPYELSPEEIRFSILPIKIENLPPASDATIIGQGKALAALSLGLGIKAKGYNVYIQGAPGTGRRTALLRALSQYKPSLEHLRDYAYVSNFTNPTEPILLTFPRGKAREFKQDLHNTIEEIKRIILVHSESEEFKNKKGLLLSSFEQEENRRLSMFEQEATTAGFQIVQINDGEEQSTELLPVKEGKPISFEELQSQVASGEVSPQEWNTLREQYYGLMDRMRHIFEDLRQSRLTVDQKITELTREMLRHPIETVLGRLKETYPSPKINQWITTLQEDILSHLSLFLKDRGGQEQNSRRSHTSLLSRYGINIIVDRSTTTELPVIFENRPTLPNLFGSIESPLSGQEDLRTAYLRIRSGSLLQAAGGILVLRAEDILDEEESWTYLKRVLQSGIAEIQNQPNPYSPPSIIKPEPIEIDVKVILMGGEMTYDVLYQQDPDFQKLFKICAEFSNTMPRLPETEQLYCSFLQRVVHEENLLPLTSEGACAILRWSARQAEHRQKLSTQFSLVVDLLREASWYASRQGYATIDSKTVRYTLEQKQNFYNLPEETLQAMILSDEIIIQLEGTAVGKANGIAVHDRGYYAYGIPVVVSARVAPGDGGVINIEGESGLSGEIFDKAVLILSGYLRSRYARNFPLSITASVCFEQMYTPIDGDSATAVQLCTILSAISGIPLRQDLAMTGSVNQLGDMQPVGGVSEKVEGFFTICEKRGLTGSQGVIVPKRNIANLILNERVEEAIQQGLFHIYAVETIDQALEILTGKPAGELDKNGNFPPGTVNYAVSQELRRMAEVIHAFET
ncbi:MAG TPA: ATP-binding protein [Termitinemataceae bacterium]|nr:ATP-binding protein [Termitinemataceae bacterium]HPP99385.1 ATP-binding protein [Termitinemataceae bacterium]